MFSLEKLGASYEDAFVASFSSAVVRLLSSNWTSALPVHARILSSLFAFVSTVLLPLENHVLFFGLLGAQRLLEVYRDLTLALDA